MLRRCRLCARQLSSSRSLALSARHRPKDNLYQADADAASPPSEPVASTSKHVFVEPSWTSTLPRCLQRRRNHSTAATATLHTQEANENRFEHDFGKALLKKPSNTTSLWKGKSRAVEPDVPPSTLETPSIAASEQLESYSRNEDSASAQQPIPPAVTIDPSIAAIPEIRESIQHFDKLIQEGDFITCFLAIVESCLYSSQTSGPYASEEIRHRIQRMNVAFSNHPRTSSLQSLLLRHPQTSQEPPPLEIVVPLAFRAVLEQDAYRHWRVRLQQVLKRAIPFLISNSRESADVCLAAVMAEFKIQRRWESIEQIGRSAHSAFGRWTLATLDPYLEAIDQLDRHNLAPTLDSLDPSLQPFPQHRTYNYLLKCHLSNRNLPAAKAVLDAMIAAGRTPDRTTFEFVYSGYRSIGGYSTFLDDAKQLKLAPTRELVNQVLESLINEEGVSAGVTAVESLPAKAEERVNAALTSGSSTTPIDYIMDGSTASHSYSVTSQTTTTEVDLPPDRSTFGLMVRAYTAAGGFEKALDTYTEMLQAGHAPSAFTQSVLIAAYSKMTRETPQSPTASRMTALLGFKDVPSKAHSKILRARLPSLLRSEGVAGALRMLTEMNTQEIRIDDRSVSIIFNYLAKSGLASPSDLSQLLVKLRRAHGSNYKVSDVNILIQEFIEEEARTPARQQLQPLEIPFSPNPVHNATAATRFHSIVENLSSQGSRPDGYTMMLIMKRYADSCGSPRKLWDFFKFHFLEQGFKPNAYHVSALMIAFVNAGDVYGARRAMERGIALGVRPTLQHLTILMKFFIDSQNPSAARQILREMDEWQLPVDIKVLATLAHHEAKTGHSQELLAIENEARARFPEEKWPNLIFETLKFRCRLQRRETYDALQILTRLIEEEGLVPDDHLVSSVLSAWRGARSALNRVEEGKGRAKGEAESLAQLAKTVKNLVRSRAKPVDRKREQAQPDGQMKDLLKLLNLNREIAGDYDIDDYARPEQPALSASTRKHKKKKETQQPQPQC